MAGVDEIQAFDGKITTGFITLKLTTGIHVMVMAGIAMNSENSIISMSDIIYQSKPSNVLIFNNFTQFVEDVVPLFANHRLA